MGHADRRRAHEFQCEIPVRHRVEGIRHRAVKTEIFCDGVPVNREGGTRQRAGTQWQFVQPRAGIGKPAPVTSEHFHIGQQVMAEGDGLSRLQMGKSRHDRFGMGFGLVEQCRLQGLQLHVERIDFITHPKPEIGRHLIIARACGVQPSRRIADQFPKTDLDIHVDVFECGREGEVSALDLSRNRV